MYSRHGSCCGGSVTARRFARPQDVPASLSWAAWLRDLPPPASPGNLWSPMRFMGCREGAEAAVSRETASEGASHSNLRVATGAALPGEADSASAQRRNAIAETREGGGEPGAAGGVAEAVWGVLERRLGHARASGDGKRAGRGGRSEGAAERRDSERRRAAGADRSAVWAGAHELTRLSGGGIPVHVARDVVVAALLRDAVQGRIPESAADGAGAAGVVERVRAGWEGLMGVMCAEMPGEVAADDGYASKARKKLVRCVGLGRGPHMRPSQRVTACACCRVCFRALVMSGLACIAISLVLVPRRAIRAQPRLLSTPVDDIQRGVEGLMEAASPCIRGTHAAHAHAGAVPDPLPAAASHHLRQSAPATAAHLLAACPVGALLALSDQLPVVEGWMKAVFGPSAVPEGPSGPFQADGADAAPRPTVPMPPRLEGPAPASRGLTTVPHAPGRARAAALALCLPEVLDPSARQGIQKGTQALLSLGFSTDQAWNLCISTPALLRRKHRDLSASLAVVTDPRGLAAGHELAVQHPRILATDALRSGPRVSLLR